MSDSGPYNDPLTGPQTVAGLRTVTPAAITAINADARVAPPAAMSAAPIAAIAIAKNPAEVQRALGLVRRLPPAVRLARFLLSS